MMVDVDNPLRILRPIPVYILAVGDQKLANIMTVSWITPVAKKPPTIGVVVDKANYTHKLINNYLKFSLCVPPADMAPLVKYIGTYSGREIDKVSKTGVKINFTKDGFPIVEGCLAYVFVEVVKKVDFGPSTIYIGQIRGARANSSYFDARLGWKNLLEKEGLLLHLAKHFFVKCKGEIVRIIETPWGVAVKKPWREKRFWEE